MNASVDFKEGTLLIVWNADSGWQYAVLDSLHKRISPQTYPCKLCQLTYGMVGPKSEWQMFLRSLDRDVVFYHRDEFTASGIQLPSAPSFPVIMEHRNSSWKVLMDAEELNQVESLEGLLVVLQQRLYKAS